MGYVTVRTLYRVAIAQGWPTVPATLQSVELQPAGSSTLQVVTSYTYRFGGKEFTGHRLSLYGPDNLGSFYEDASRELHAYMARHEAYPAHVNPRDPQESVLMPVLRWEAIGFYLVFTIVFGVAGWAILISGCLQIVRARREAMLVKRYPDEPWKQRLKWSQPAIKASQAKDAIIEICFAVFWNAATFPVVLVIPREIANGRYVALTFLVIPLIGIGLVFWALVAVARATRFARTYLSLETMPGRPGQHLQGHISAPKALAAAEEVVFTLRCERVSHSSQSPNQRIRVGRTGMPGTGLGTAQIWHHYWHASVGRSEQPAGAVTLPVNVEIPAGYPGSSLGPGDQFSWYLDANAPLKGADFSVEFEIPVFDV
jgi:hypothetical protein